MNNYSTIGRLTGDPQTNYTQTGRAITSFDIAQDVGFGDKKKTIFWPCKLWGERGETFAKYAVKGDQIGIVASIDQDEWTDKTSDKKRKKLFLLVNDFTFLSKGGKKDSQNKSESTPSTDEVFCEKNNEDDIPF